MSSLINKQNNNSPVEQEGLTLKELTFLLALINDHTYSGQQLEIAFGIKIKIKTYLEHMIQENK